MYKAVLFDLDGTLLDTSVGVIKSIEYTINELKLSPLSETELKTFIGPPIYNSLKERYNFSDEEAAEATRIFRDTYKDRFLFEAEVYQNLFKVLETLRNRKIKIGVATYKREDYAIRLLEHFGITDYCDVVHGADHDNKLTKSDIIKLCMDEMGIESPTEVVLVGDTSHDAIGAKNLEVDFIGVTFGFEFKKEEDINKYPNIGSIDNMIELIEIVG